MVPQAGVTSSCAPKPLVTCGSVGSLRRACACEPRRKPPTLPPGRRTHPARQSSGERSASAMRPVRFLRSTETCERTLMHPFEFPESSDGCGAQATHPRPAEVEALARVAGLHTQLL